MEKSLYSINKGLIVVKPLKLHFCVLEIPGSILAHKQAHLLVHEISAGIITLNRMTFYSLRISILLSFTKLLIFSISYSCSLELRGLILLFEIHIPFMFVQTNSTSFFTGVTTHCGFYSSQWFSSILLFLHIAFSTVLLPLFANLLQCPQSISSVVSL